MDAEVRFVRLRLLRLQGADESRGTAYGGWLVQFGAFGPNAAVCRVVTFRGDSASAREVAVEWSKIAALGAALRTFCERPLDVSARFDTSDSWDEIDLTVSLDGRDSSRLHLHMRSSGFEGPDTQLLAQIIDSVEMIAGVSTGRP